MLTPETARKTKVDASRLLKLPLELRLAILRYILPSQTYFIFRGSQALSLIVTPLQKPLALPSKKKWDPQAARRNDWVVLTHPRTPCTEEWMYLLFICNQIKEDCYAVLYGENRFIFHVGNQTPYGLGSVVQPVPFKNPLVSVPSEPAPYFPQRLIPYLRRVYLIVRVCINDADPPSPTRRMTRSQRDLHFNHINMLRDWMNELAKRFAPGTHLTNFELIAHHFKRMDEEQVTRFINTVPTSIPGQADIDRWQAIHKDVKHFFGWVPDHFPNPDVFNALKQLNGIDQVKVTGLDPAHKKNLETVMSTMALSSVDSDGSQETVLSHASSTSQDSYETSQKRPLEEENPTSKSIGKRRKKELV